MKKEDLILIFKKMYLIRFVELEIAKRYNKGLMRCPTHLSVGQEAIAAGISVNLSKNDFVVSTHRSHAHYLGKNGNLYKMLAEIHGKKDGCSMGKGGSMHLIDLNVKFMGSSAIVGNSIPTGVGLALSAKLKATKQISCVYFGEGAIEEGVFYESINFAVVKKLPVLFICENNLYSVYSPLSVRQPKERNICKMVNAMGIESYKMNGNDAINISKKIFKIVKKIRKLSKPIFVELSTYRWLEHCGPNYDNNIGYRKNNEFLKWKKHDPLSLMYRNLKHNNIKENEIKKIKQHIENKVISNFNKAEEAEFPKTKEALTQVYAK